MVLRVKHLVKPIIVDNMLFFSLFNAFFVSVIFFLCSSRFYEFITPTLEGISRVTPRLLECVDVNWIPSPVNDICFPDDYGDAGSFNGTRVLDNNSTASNVDDLCSVNDYGDAGFFNGTSFLNKNSTASNVDDLLAPDCAYKWHALYNGFLPVAAVVLLSFVVYLTHRWMKLSKDPLPQFATPNSHPIFLQDMCHDVDAIHNPQEHLTTVSLDAEDDNIEDNSSSSTGPSNLTTTVDHNTNITTTHDLQEMLSDHTTEYCKVQDLLQRKNELQEVAHLQALLRTKEEHWKRCLYEKESTLEQVKDENEYMKTQTLEINNMLASTKEDVRMLMNKEEEIKSINEKLEKENAQLLIDVTKVHELLDNNKKHLKTQEESLRNCSDVIEELQNENSADKTEIKHLENMLSAAKTEMRQQVLQKEKLLEELSQKLNHQNLQLENEASKSQNLLQRQNDFKQEVAHLQKRLQTQEEDWKRSLNKSESTNKQLQEENATIKNEVQNLADLLDATRVEVKKKEMHLLHNQRIQERRLKKAKQQDQLDTKLQAHQLLVDGLLFFDMNDMEKALEKLNLSIQQHPLGVAHMTRAKIYKALGSIEEALQDSLRAQKLENTYVGHYLLSAELYTVLGRPQEALNTLNDARDRFDMRLVDLGSPLQKLFEKATHLQMYMARALQCDGEAALHLWERAIALAPASSYLKLQAAQGYILSQRLDLAKTLVEEVCKRETQNSDALYMLGFIHSSMGEYQHGLDIFHRMSVNGHEKAQKAALILQQSLLYQEGETFLQNGHYEKALSSFCEALEMGLLDQRDYKNLLYARAMVSVLLGDHSTAAEDTTEILQMDSKHLPSRTLRILCSMALGCYYQASSDLENMATDFDEDFVANTRHLLEIATADDYYTALGLDKNCTFEDIKKAYRKAARLHHPDKLSHVSEDIRSQHEEEMKRITTAHRILTDENEKFHYDTQQTNLLQYSSQWQKNLIEWITEEYAAAQAGETYTLNLPL